jgi:UDP-glucose 4-epimerase
MRVAVTGISGFIGGQIAIHLKENGHQVFGIDRRPVPNHLSAVNRLFYKSDFAASRTLEKLQIFDPQVIVHCAGTSLVGPSLTDPCEYYENNVVKTVELLKFIKNYLPNTRIMFSSSASVYGVNQDFCKENAKLDPVSPYGESKMMIEKVMSSFSRAYNLDYVAFRYFNACGADSLGRHGQETGATHLIAKILESVKHKTQFICNGRDYSTKDGTCVRDYIHVEDIARAHLLALDKRVKSGVYNLGTETGHSNLEVIDVARAVTKSTIPVTFGPRREGDPDSLTANASLFKTISGWQPTFTLRHMVQHAWAWYNSSMFDNDLNNHYNSR